MPQAGNPGNNQGPPDLPNLGQPPGHLRCSVFDPCTGQGVGGFPPTGPGGGEPGNPPFGGACGGDCGCGGSCGGGCGGSCGCGGSWGGGGGGDGGGMPETMPPIYVGNEYGMTTA